MTADEPNVLLLILDSARARNTSLHGYHRETTPFLKRFGESATTYTQARAPAGRSLPSHASIFTGYLPQEHEVNGLDRKLASNTSVFETLSDRGYATGLFTDNPYLTDLDTGLSNGFDAVVNNKDLFEDGLSPSAFVEQEGGRHADFLLAALRSDAPAKSVLNGLSWTLKWRFPRLSPQGVVFSRGFTYAERFDEWRASLDGGPWAACINLMDTHVPFRPGDEYDRWRTTDSERAAKRVDLDDVEDVEGWKYALLENRYDGTMRQADAVVESIVESLRDDGELDDTFVVVTADHGEGFGERSPIRDVPTAGHGDGVEEELLHVPLVVRVPGQRDGRRIDDPVGLVDTRTAVKRVLDGEMADPTFVTDRRVFAGGLRNGEPVDAAYAAHRSHGVEKYVRGPDGSWTVHAPTPRTAYRTADAIPASVRDRMGALEPAAVTHVAEANVSESARRQLTALGYAE